MFSAPEDYLNDSSDHNVFPSSSFLEPAPSHYSNDLISPFDKLSQPLKQCDNGINEHSIVPADVPAYLLFTNGGMDSMPLISSGDEQHHGTFFSSTSILDNLSSAMATYDFNPNLTDKEDEVGKDSYDVKSSSVFDHHRGPTHSSYQTSDNNQFPTSECMQPPKQLLERESVSKYLEDQDKSAKSYKICQFEDCKTQASFKFIDDKKVRYCAKHKHPGMVDCRSKRCENPTCHVIASFNIVGDKKRRFCKLHAEPGMEYVGSKRTRANAAEDVDNLEKDETEDYHNDSTLDDVDKINALILQQEMSEGELLRGSNMDSIVSNSHSSLQESVSEAHQGSSESALQGKNTLNLAADANLDPLSYLQYLIPSTDPEFNQTFPTQDSYPVTISSDKSHTHSYTPDNVNKQIIPNNHLAPTSNAEQSDVGKIQLLLKKVNKRKICEEPNCQTQASFKLTEDSKFRFCAKHKLTGMADFHSRKCEHLGCEVIASFNAPGETKRRFCKGHALHGMQHIGSRKRKNNEIEQEIVRPEPPPPVAEYIPIIEEPVPEPKPMEAVIVPSSSKRGKKGKVRNKEDPKSSIATAAITATNANVNTTIIENSSGTQNSIPQAPVYQMDEMVLHQHQQQQLHLQMQQQQQQQYLAHMFQHHQQPMRQADMNQMMYQQQRDMHQSQLLHPHHLQQQQQHLHHHQHHQHHLQHHHLVDPVHLFEPQHQYIHMQQVPGPPQFVLLDVLHPQQQHLLQQQQQQHERSPHLLQQQVQQLHPIHHIQHLQHDAQHSKQVALPLEHQEQAQQLQLEQHIGDPQSHQLALMFEDFNGPDNNNYQLNGDEFFYQFFHGDAISDGATTNVSNAIHVITSSLNGD